MAAAKKKRKPNAAFMKPVTPDVALSAVVGNKPLPRTELTKKLWVYIKKNGLQDKKNRTNINADDKLKIGLRRQEDRDHVRDDQAGQQARQVNLSIVNYREAESIAIRRSWPCQFYPTLAVGRFCIQRNNSSTSLVV